MTSDQRGPTLAVRGAPRRQVKTMMLREAKVQHQVKRRAAEGSSREESGISGVGSPGSSESSSAEVGKRTPESCRR